MLLCTFITAYRGLVARTSHGDYSPLMTWRIFVNVVTSATEFSSNELSLVAIYSNDQTQE